jgi:hypothetical protein
MASRTLRSRTVESSQRDDLSTPQEGECDWPHDQPEGLDNELGVEETTQLSTAEESQAIGPEAQKSETTPVACDVIAARCVETVFQYCCVTSSRCLPAAA